MILADAVPPVFSSPTDLLRGWEFVPLVDIPVVVIGVLYWLGYRRVRRQPRPVFPAWRAWCFITALAVCVASVQGPVDTYADVDIAVHMAQHVFLLYLVAPLAVLGAPATIALRAMSPRNRARWVLPVLHNRLTYVLTRPIVAGLLYACALLGSHFTAWYNASLENEYIHDLEHLSYIVFGFLLWEVLIGVDPIRGRSSYPQRIMLAFLEMPVAVIISMAFILANHPLYSYYAALPEPWGGSHHVLANQGLGGAIMWIPSGAVTLVVVAFLGIAWFRQDESRQLRAEAAHDRVVAAVGVDAELDDYNRRLAALRAAATQRAQW